MKQRERRIMKLYEGLPYPKRAALALHYACQQDGEEMNRIHSTVPRHTYRMLDAEYQDWADGLFNMAVMWGLQWWQAQARLMAATGYILAMNDTDTAETVHANMAELSDSAHSAQVRLASLRAALEDVCSACGLEVQTALDLTGTPDYTPPVPPDAEQRQQIAEDLRACLPG